MSNSEIMTYIEAVDSITNIGLVCDSRVLPKNIHQTTLYQAVSVVQHNKRIMYTEMF
jgi:hypothetical protein